MPIDSSRTARGSNRRPDRLDQQQHARAADEGGLAEAGQRLRLAVAEAVFAVGRLDGVAHREQRHDGGRGVEEGIDQGREDSDGVRHQPGGQLGGDQQRCDDDGGDRRLFLQAGLGGRVGERSGRRRGGLLCGGLGHVARKIGRPATCLNRAVSTGPSQPGRLNRAVSTGAALHRTVGIGAGGVRAGQRKGPVCAEPGLRVGGSGRKGRAFGRELSGGQAGDGFPFGRSGP